MTTTCGRITRILLVTAVAGLAACASAPNREAMSVGTPATRNFPYSVSVQTQGGTETSAMTGASVSNDDLKAAIESSIMQSKLFKSVLQGRNGDYELAVTVTQLSKPVFGASFTVDMEAGWALTRTSDRTVAMRKVIKSSHTATLNDAVVGATRMRMAVEGAARNNIQQGLQAIADLGNLEAGVGAEGVQTAAATPRAGTYPRMLAGAEITAHFARYASIEARQGKGETFTLRISRDGTIERSCPNCRLQSGSGSMVVRQDEGLVCFQWRVYYPASGCFKLVQTSGTDFLMRAVDQEIVIRYSVQP